LRKFKEAIWLELCYHILRFDPSTSYLLDLIWHLRVHSF